METIVSGQLVHFARLGLHHALAFQVESGGGHGAAAGANGRVALVDVKRFPGL